MQCKFEVTQGAVAAIEEAVALLVDVQWTVWEERLAGRTWVTGYFGSRGEANDAFCRLAVAIHLNSAVEAESTRSFCWPAERLRGQGASTAEFRIKQDWIAGEAELKELADADWAESYKAHFKAWGIGRRHWVPEWERETHRQTLGEEIVWLDPGMAFGTGNHESTRLCCERLVEYVDARKPGASGRRRGHGRTIAGGVGGASGVIDAGCGSGILAISAARFGLGPVVGFDNDPIAIRVSRENAMLNEVAAKVDFFEADLTTGLAGRQAGLVLANILTDVIRRDAKALVGAVAPGGWLALSGILAGELADLRADFLAVAEDIPANTPGVIDPELKTGAKPDRSVSRPITASSVGWRTASRRLGEWADLLLIRGS
jgi:ribosomal protein L11 methyltransferase